MKKKARVYVNKQSWETIGDRRLYFRSKLEKNYALYLEFLKTKNLIVEWEHEPQTFWFLEIKRGVRSYKPDFKVVKPDGSHYWVEVKGYMDAKSKTKIKRFNKYYPQEPLQIVTNKSETGITCGLNAKIA